MACTPPAAREDMEQAKAHAIRQSYRGYFIAEISLHSPTPTRGLDSH